MPQKFLKSTARTILGSSTASSLKLNRLPDTGLTIFSLHRIEQTPNGSGSAIPASAFRNFLRWAAKKFELTTFGETFNPSEDPRPKAILSFDDGYGCYKTVVEPLLEEFNVPANLNIIPATVESGLPPINVFMQNIIEQGGENERKAINANLFDGLLDISPPSDFALKASRLLKSQPINDQAQYWPALRSVAESMASFTALSMLDLDTLRSLKRTELGAHSFEHASMEAEDPSYIDTDFQKCRDWFGKELGRDVDVYAFPNGSASEDAAQRALDAGYTHVLLVGERFSRLNRRIHHRINMHGSTVNHLRSCITRASI